MILKSESNDHEDLQTMLDKLRVYAERKSHCQHTTVR